tara:strand:+ start:47 stop:1573 length:1527 start_codon:yes stop_codon:yes gene_type:complete
VKQTILKTINDLNKWREKLKANINFVPTMGNLHKGHLNLIEQSSKDGSNETLVSIFVNPLQFNDRQDFKNYPKTRDKDIKLAFSSGASAIFLPSENEILNIENLIHQKASKQLSSNLCGQHRKGHFDGVCTIVLRMLKIINPSKLYLGEKDWQQLLILKNMINELNLNIEIQSIPTQRDIDGVPFSSRNNLLTNLERRDLQLFSEELKKAEKIFKMTKSINLQEINKHFKNKNLKVEYLQHLGAFSLNKSIDKENITILAGAILCGNTRLIDHVFLMKRKPIIAIDGPAGSGKSTVTKLIAKKLDYIYLDTGAMYRALSWFLISEKIDYKNENTLEECLNKINIVFKTSLNSEQDIFINNICVTDQIRTQRVSSIVSSIASISQVREFLVKEQRKIGNYGGLVAEGRDIGTTVFPNADIKIYLNASIDERAKRRKIELELNGQDINFDKLKYEIERRDFDDSTRNISPLAKAEDALEIITDNYSAEEIASKIIKIFHEKIPKELKNDF